MEDAIWHLKEPTLISDVPPGTGLTRSVLLAQVIGSRMLKEFVHPFPINVPPSILLELVSLATKAMYSTMVPVNLISISSPLI